MAIDNTDVVDELGAYKMKNNETVKAMFYDMPSLDPYLKTVTKVQGKYPAIHSVTDNVVQRFTSVWTPMGTTKFVPNILTSYRQKVNFPIVPADVLNSYLAYLYVENLKPEAMPISKYILEKELKPKVQEDMAVLMMTGKYDNTKPQDEFGWSMDGVNTLLDAGIADGSMYKINLSAEPTESNALDIMTEFEKGMPLKVVNTIKEVHVGQDFHDNYVLDYENTLGTNTNYKDGDAMKTRLRKYKLVPHNYLNGTNKIFATPPGNFLKLIDIFNAPQLTDVQKQDYEVRIFMECELGLGFYINQLVMVGTYDDTFQGLGSSEGDGNNLYYA